MYGLQGEADNGAFLQPFVRKPGRATRLSAIELPPFEKSKEKSRTAGSMFAPKVPQKTSSVGTDFLKRTSI